MPQEPENTPKRDHDYGTSGNISYEQWKATTTYEISVTKKFGKEQDLEKLYKTLVDQLENPKILGLFNAPKWMVDTKMQEAGFEGIEDAFLQANITTPSTKGQKTR